MVKMDLETAVKEETLLDGIATLTDKVVKADIGRSVVTALGFGASSHHIFHMLT